jgi:hypothetical protein
MEAVIAEKLSIVIDHELGRARNIMDIARRRH